MNAIDCPSLSYSFQYFFHISPDDIERNGDGSTSRRISCLAILRLYVGDHHVQPGETHRVENGQMVCFARDESGSHVHFLKFQAVEDDKIMQAQWENHMGNHMGNHIKHVIRCFHFDLTAMVGTASGSTDGECQSCN